MLILTGSNGILLACSAPVACNHNDAFGFVETVEKMVSDIRIDGLFLNAGAGFDPTGFREYCYRDEIMDNIEQNKRNGVEMEQFFDDLLYKYKFVVERTNDWIDPFKAILVCFETNKIHWGALNIIAFCVIVLHRL